MYGSFQRLKSSLSRQVCHIQTDFLLSWFTRFAIFNESFVLLQNESYSRVCRVPNPLCVSICGSRSWVLLRWKRCHMLFSRPTFPTMVLPPSRFPMNAILNFTMSHIPVRIVCSISAQNTQRPSANYTEKLCGLKTMHPECQINYRQYRRITS